VRKNDLAVNANSLGVSSLIKCVLNLQSKQNLCILLTMSFTVEFWHSLGFFL